MRRPYALTRGAAADLRGIVRYTVVAILHERMDLMARLKNRLG